MSGRRELLWDSMIEAEMLSVYWQLQLERETAYSNAMRLAIGIASSGTIATLWLFEGHVDIQKGVPALAGILSIVYAAFFPRRGSPRRLISLPPSMNLPPNTGFCGPKMNTSSRSSIGRSISD